MGDPSIVCAILTYNILQKPKSPNLTFPSDKKILSGFKSRCITLFLLSYLNAYINWANIFKAYCSCNIFFLLSNESKVPPLQYS